MYYCRKFYCMQKYFLWISLTFMFFSAQSQTDLKKASVFMQECLNLNTGDQPAVITLYENSGMIEYKQAYIIQRIKLADLHAVQVNANTSGYSVDIKCLEDFACINFIKGDTSNTAFKATAVQFNDVVLANTFAENLSNLVVHYKTNEPPLEKTLFKTKDGMIPLLGAKKTTTPAAEPKQVKQVPKEEKEESEPEEATKPIEEKKPSAKSRRAEKKEAAEEVEPEEKEVVKKPSRKSAKKEAEEASADEEEKLTPREKRKAAREAEAENGDKNDAEEAVVAKKKVNRNKLIEDVDDNARGDAKSKSSNDFCDQLKNILQSGKENKFKSIEGKLTNEEAKINDSKIKLKGARKSYLSWYKKERAFISELKSGTDYETIFKSFEEIQTELDACLGAGWNMEDHSNSDEYAKLKTEVKDVEFKKENDDNMPAIRVIFIEDNSKFTMFIRVK